MTVEEVCSKNPRIAEFYELSNFIPFFDKVVSAYSSDTTLILEIFNKLPILLENFSFDELLKMSSKHILFISKTSLFSVDRNLWESNNMESKSFLENLSLCSVEGKSFFDEIKTEFSKEFDFINKYCEKFDLPFWVTNNETKKDFFRILRDSNYCSMQRLNKYKSYYAYLKYVSQFALPFESASNFKNIYIEKLSQIVHFENDDLVQLKDLDMDCQHLVIKDYQNTFYYSIYDIYDPDSNLGSILNEYTYGPELIFNHNVILLDFSYKTEPDIFKKYSNLQILNVPFSEALNPVKYIVNNVLGALGNKLVIENKENYNKLFFILMTILPQHKEFYDILKCKKVELILDNMFNEYSYENLISQLWRLKANGSEYSFIGNIVVFNGLQFNINDILGEELWTED